MRADSTETGDRLVDLTTVVVDVRQNSANVVGTRGLCRTSSTGFEITGWRSVSSEIEQHSFCAIMRTKRQKALFTQGYRVACL